VGFDGYAPTGMEDGGVTRMLRRNAGCFRRPNKSFLRNNKKTVMKGGAIAPHGTDQEDPRSFRSIRVNPPSSMPFGVGKSSGA
jgi:hypothetical protein